MPLLWPGSPCVSATPLCATQLHATWEGKLRLWKYNHFWCCWQFCFWCSVDKYKYFILVSITIPLTFQILKLEYQALSTTTNRNLVFQYSVWALSKENLWHQLQFPALAGNTFVIAAWNMCGELRIMLTCSVKLETLWGKYSFPPHKRFYNSEILFFTIQSYLNQVLRASPSFE